MYNVTETAPLPNGRALWVLDLKGAALTYKIFCKSKIHRISLHVSRGQSSRSAKMIMRSSHFK